MSNPKAREVRQLGSLRQSTSTSRFSPRPVKIDRSYEGISGSAINIPVPKAVPEVSTELTKRSLCSPPAAVKKPAATCDQPTKVEKRLTQETNHENKKLKEALVRLCSCKVTIRNMMKEAAMKKPAATCDQPTKVEKRLTQEINHENKKLKEALEREKELQQRVAALVQLVDSLKTEVKDKDISIANLSGQLLAQEEEYKVLFEKEQSSHEGTKQNLEKVKVELGQNLQHVEELKRQHANQVKDMAAAVKKCEANIADIKVSKEKEIALREEKLERLKKQMADALTGNSKERHLQLDELSKELGKVQEEAEVLRIKLKSMQKTSKDGCTNCESLCDKLTLLSSSVKQEEKKNNELKEKLTLLQKRLSETQSKTSLENTKSKTASKVAK